MQTRLNYSHESSGEKFERYLKRFLVNNKTGLSNDDICDLDFLLEKLCRKQKGYIREILNIQPDIQNEGKDFIVYHLICSIIECYDHYLFNSFEELFLIKQIDNIPRIQDLRYITMCMMKLLDMIRRFKHLSSYEEMRIKIAIEGIDCMYKRKVADNIQDEDLMRIASEDEAFMETIKSYGLFLEDLI